ncbi:MAG: hypothetical protein PF518_10370 [Spirochaetaceae bacterium]|jgi:hypothetical protein|nr:hypothetical protein [Spirochaetaceae bacterium]
MKKILLTITVVLLLFASCDGFNTNIDDLPRTLRISARQMTDVDGGWADADEGSQLVSTGFDTYNGTIADVTITPAKDSYLRKEEVTATFSILGAGLRFAFWLLPSRTELAIDDESTIGNILYDDLDDGELIDLRTNSSEAEIIAAFAYDGNVNAGVGLGATLIDLSYQILSNNSVEFTYTINNSSSDKTVKEPRFRFFDDTGNAVNDWTDFFKNNDSVTFLDAETVSFTFPGVLDPSTLGNWNVVVIYQDPANDDVYVVK